MATRHCLNTPRVLFRTVGANFGRFVYWGRPLLLIVNSTWCMQWFVVSYNIVHCSHMFARVLCAICVELLIRHSITEIDGIWYTEHPIRGRHIYNVRNKLWKSLFHNALSNKDSVNNTCCNEPRSERCVMTLLRVSRHEVCCATHKTMSSLLD